MRKSVFIIILACTLFALTLSISSCTRSDEKPEARPEASPAMDNPADKVSIKGFRFLSQELGGTNIKVNAKKAVLTERHFRQFRLALGNVVELDAPSVEVTGDSGITKITSRNAVFDPARKLAIFTGDACVETSARKLTAGVIGWRYRNGNFEVRAPYILTAKGGRTEGTQNAVFGPGLKRLEAKRAVQR